VSATRPASADLLVPDAAAWRAWLEANHDTADVVILVLAKGGATQPTTLTYEQAVQEALCYGWIDSQAWRRDEATFRQRYSRRRKRSPWSPSNAARVARLIAEGRMRAAGLAEVERAQADGRWPTP
jgi:uncharacterized protein YdeI (YjbR/CyaY-like superfamily)